MNTRSWKADAAFLIAGLLALPVITSRTCEADEPAGSVRVSDGIFYGTQTQPNSFFFKGDNASGYYTQYPQRQPTYVDWQVWAPGPPYGPECSGFTGAMISHATYFRARRKAFTCNSYSYLKTRFWDTWDQLWIHTSWEPVSPGASDPRDSQVYSAEGTGIPMSVPLAPVVKYTYNYGWGVPSSRLTRINASYQNGPSASMGGGGASGAPTATAQGNPPVIYWPTDTTQKGYYYKQVPTWQGASSIRYGAPAPTAVQFAGRSQGTLAACPPGTQASPKPVPQPAAPPPAP